MGKYILFSSGGTEYAHIAIDKDITAFGLVFGSPYKAIFNEGNTVNKANSMRLTFFLGADHQVPAWLWPWSIPSICFKDD